MAEQPRWVRWSFSGLVALVVFFSGYITNDVKQNATQDQNIRAVTDRLDRLEKRLDIELIGQRRFDDLRAENERAHANLERRMENGFEEMRASLADHERRSRIRQEQNR